MNLGTTLLVVALLATIAFALASLAVTHLNLMGTSSNRVQAENLAHSAITQAIEKLVQGDGTFGESAAPGDSLTAIHLEAPDGSVGLLTFSPSDAGSLDIPYSVNNLNGTGSVAGYEDRVVPVAAAHLVGVGRCRGVERRVECILHVPPFPYAIASSVPIRSVGGLMIAGVNDPADMLDVINNGPGDPKAVPADLVTNATIAQAMVLGDGTTVAGDAQSSGGIELDPNGGTEILGEMRTYSEAAPIPRIDPATYDPVLTGRPYVTLTTVGPSPVFEGTLRHQGDLSINGGVTLDGALLYVDGSLTVSGGMTGDGAVIVTGNTSIQGASSLASEDLVALVSMGDITLDGAGKDFSFFQGLIYTEGSFQAEQVTLLGTLIANPPEGSAEVFLRDANVIYTPEATEVDVGINGGAKTFYFNSSGKPMSNPHPSGNQLTVTLESDGFYYIDGVSTGQTDVAGASQAVYDAVAAMTGGTPPPGIMGHLQSSIPQGLADLEPVDPNGEAPEIVTVKPSQFISLADSVRVLLWKDMP